MSQTNISGDNRQEALSPPETFVLVPQKNVERECSQGTGLQHEGKWVRYILEGMTEMRAATRALKCLQTANIRFALPSCEIGCTLSLLRPLDSFESPGWRGGEFRSTCWEGVPLTLGKEVFVVSSPFGALSPNVLFNSVSNGIISNVLPSDIRDRDPPPSILRSTQSDYPRTTSRSCDCNYSTSAHPPERVGAETVAGNTSTTSVGMAQAAAAHGAVFLTDSRCMSGSEGAAVTDSLGDVIGILLPPLIHPSCDVRLSPPLILL